MATLEVILATLPKPSYKCIVTSCPHLTVMYITLLGKRSCPPTLHSGGGYCHPINAATFDGDIPAYVFEAFPPKELATSGYMLDIGETVVVMSSIFDKRRSGYSKIRKLSEFLKEKFEIICFKRNISVKISYDMVINRSNLLISSIKTTDLRRKISVNMFWHTHKLNP